MQSLGYRRNTRAMPLHLASSRASAADQLGQSITSGDATVPSVDRVVT